jgi:uncharacterized flavoprotein (TIGR03862 family)
VIGAGPAGLMAAETLSAAGWTVDVYDRMPSIGRKFLMAGRGGLNLTHSEPFASFVTRYGPEAAHLRPALEAFPPAALIAWAEGLGQRTFVGSSGRVFPRALKASPLLRAWLVRLAAQGVTIHTRHRWLGWTEAGDLRFDTPGGERIAPRPHAIILALGGASWPRLGSDGGWAPILRERGVEVACFRSANVGFDVPWSAPFRGRFAGAPLKSAAFTFARTRLRGEAVITRYGLEGGAIYALSRPLRDAIERAGRATLWLDLSPDLREPELAARLSRARSAETVTKRLRKAGLPPEAIGLLREAHGTQLPTDVAALARSIKGAPLTLTGVQGLDHAISSAGGIALSELDRGFQLRRLPGVFIAGEMLDWEAPTGGYLLQACFALGVASATQALSVSTGVD